MNAKVLVYVKRGVCGGGSRRVVAGASAIPRCCRVRLGSARLS
jgi:hypothetical protein